MVANNGFPIPRSVRTQRPWVEPMCRLETLQFKSGLTGLAATVDAIRGAHQLNRHGLPTRLLTRKATKLAEVGQSYNGAFEFQCKPVRSKIE